MKTTIGRTVAVLNYNPLTGEFTACESAYDGPVSDKAWRGINALFLDEQAAGKFYPDDPADVYQHAIQAAETAAEKIAAAKLAMLNYAQRKVLPKREEHAAIAAFLSGDWGSLTTEEIEFMKEARKEMYK